MSETPASQLSLFDAREPAAAWTVRHSARARRLAVRVFVDGRVEVVVPPRTPECTVRDFLVRHGDWIERRRERTRREQPLPAAFPPARLELPAFGECWSLEVLQGAGRARLMATGVSTLEARGRVEEASLRWLLRTWVAGRAAARLAPWLEALSRETDLGYARMVVRHQRTRWGSCSTRGTISLNACLAFQRPAVVRYLLLHELAHTRHMNHSSRFWRLVARHEPDWRALDRELVAGWRHVPGWMHRDAG